MVINLLYVCIFVSRTHEYTSVSIKPRPTSDVYRIDKSFYNFSFDHSSTLNIMF